MSFDLDQLELPSTFDVAALERGHTAMKEIVPEMDKVQLIVTSEFDETVKSHLPGGGAGSTYTQDRGDFGVAMGKVLGLGDDETVVILDARVLLVGQEKGAPERTFKHEAFHVALRQRGEVLYDLETQPEVGIARREYLAMAAIACEEFRVELPLCQDDPNEQYGWYPKLLRSAERDFRSLSAEYQASHHQGASAIEAISLGVGKCFNSIATASGYVAAVMAATGVGLPEIDPKVRGRVLGTSGVEVINRLRELPSAAEPTDRALLQEAAIEVADLLERWSSEIGFQWEDLDGDEVFFHVLKPAKWLLSPPL